MAVKEKPIHTKSQSLTHSLDYIEEASTLEGAEAAENSKHQHKHKNKTTRQTEKRKSKPSQ